MFGLMGAHRTGKTTLAKRLAEKTGIYFFQVSTTKIMQEAGYDPVSYMDLQERIEAQEHLMLSYLDMLENIPRPFITDRTPIDMAAYMLAEVSMLNCGPELGERIAQYVEGAMKATSALFDTLIVTRPLDRYEERPDKPPYNPAYQMHIQSLIEGMAYNMLADQVTVGFLTSNNIENRVKASYDLMERRLDEMTTERSSARIH